MALVSMILSDL